MKQFSYVLTKKSKLNKACKRDKKETTTYFGRKLKEDHTDKIITPETQLVNRKTHKTIKTNEHSLRRIQTIVPCAKKTTQRSR